MIKIIIPPYPDPLHHIHPHRSGEGVLAWPSLTPRSILPPSQQPTTSLKCSSSSRSCSNHRPHHLFIEMRNDIWNCNLSYFWWEFTRSHTQIKFGLDFMLNFICSATLRNIVANDLEIVELSIADIFRFGMMAHWYWYSIYQFAAGIKSWWGDILWISRRSRSTIWSPTQRFNSQRELSGRYGLFFANFVIFMLSWTHGRVFLGQNPAQRLIVIVCVVNLFNTDFKSIQHLHTA